MFVLDASVALSHCLAEPEFRDQARRIMSAFGSETALVPAVWRLELSNGLLRKERAKVVTKKEVDELLTLWNQLPVTVDTLGLAVVFSETLSLARRHTLSVYDASYLELAVRQKVSLASFDGALVDAARREGVPLFEGGRDGPR